MPGVKVIIPKSEIERLHAALKKFSHDVEKSKKAERMFDKALRISAKPWQVAFKGGTMYRKLRRLTGGFDDPMGNKKIKGRKVYGRRVGPKAKGKSAGWRVHFFASPARQISPGKRINFSRIYRKKNGEVIKKLKEEIEKLLTNLANQNFK